MKKFIVVLSVVICILGLSVVSSASTVYKPNQHSFVHEENGHYVLDVDIKASEFTEEQLTFWNSFTDALTGNSSGYVPFILYSKPYSLLKFCLVKSNVYRLCYEYNNHSFWLGQLSSSPGSLLVLSINVSGGTVSDFIDIIGSDFYFDSCYVFWGYGELVTHDSRNGIDKDKIDYVDWDGMRLQVQDDLGEPEPEEPAPPSSSSPAWIPPVISDPVIPKGDEYVFYDTAILKDFLSYVRDAIGKSINIGWMIFGFIMMWLVIKKVIKSFSSR